MCLTFGSFKSSKKKKKKKKNRCEGFSETQLTSHPSPDPPTPSTKVHEIQRSSMAQHERPPTRHKMGVNVSSNDSRNCKTGGPRLKIDRTAGLSREATCSYVQLPAATCSYVQPCAATWNYQPLLPTVAMFGNVWQCLAWQAPWDNVVILVIMAVLGQQSDLHEHRIGQPWTKTPWG